MVWPDKYYEITHCWTVDILVVITPQIIVQMIKNVYTLF